MSTVEIHVETQHGVTDGPRREWTVVGNVNLTEMRCVDLLYAERGGQQIPVDDFLKLAPEFHDELLRALIETEAAWQAMEQPADSGLGFGRRRRSVA